MPAVGIVVALPAGMPAVGIVVALPAGMPEHLQNHHLLMLSCLLTARHPPVSGHGSNNSRFLSCPLKNTVQN